MISDTTANALHRYTAYGLSIDSTFPLPELSPRHPEEDAAADVLVRTGTLPDAPEDAVEIGNGHLSHGETVWLSCEGACRLYIREGHEIIIEGAPDADDRILRLFVQGVALGVLL